jgi:polyisoprenoid-binding protein YceI
MRSHRALFVAAITATTALGLGISACGSDSGSGPSNALIASWNATSFTAQGTDFIAAGMGLVLTFQAAGTYQIDVTNDQIGACSSGTDCTTTGPFSRNGAQVTLDPGTADAVTFTWSIQGTTLTMTGDINGVPATIILEKV